MTSQLLFFSILLYERIKQLSTRAPQEQRTTFCKSSCIGRNLMKVHCSIVKFPEVRTFNRSVPRASRNEIEKALILLLNETKPTDAIFNSYERTIHAKLEKRLRFRKNVLRRKWMKQLVREAFELHQAENQVDRHQKSNAHVT